MASRQREWQLRQRAAGRCEVCGEPSAPFRKCAYHRTIEQNRRRKHKHT